MKKFLLSALTVVLLIACQQEEAFVEVQEQQSFVVVEKKPYTTKVSTSDVMYLAGKFNAGQAQTKESREIASVSTITDEAGEPLIYVVNYAHNQGFVLVSATKNYHPILAYNDKGYFDVNNIPNNGLKAWLADKKVDVAISDEMPQDSTQLFRSAWTKYEKQLPWNRTVQTRSSSLDSYVMSMLSQWNNEGKVYYSLDNAANILPADIYQSWLARAENSIFPLYDYMNYTFVVEVEHDNSVRKELDFQPKWDQGSGYNILFPYDENGYFINAGCTTIAQAQVMRHFEYPDELWSDMPYDVATITTCEFIRDVAIELGAYEDGSSDIDFIEKSLENYGYPSEIEVVPHDFARTMEEIDEDRPIIMQGIYPNVYEGHAWVTYGYHWVCGHKEYQLWVPIYDSEVYSEPYSQIEYYNTDYYDYPTICINWGWGGKYDGYFSDVNVWVNKNGEVHQFNRYREDIVNIARPKE